MVNQTEHTSQPTLVYYDGWCSACIKSASLFTKLDKNRGHLQCVDFRNSDDPRLELIKLDQAQLATSLHTRTPDGSIHSGPEAIRQAFTVLGRRHSASWTALPIIKPIVDWCYQIFAKNRLRWFGNHKCKDGTCAINPQASPQDSSRP
ncbi:MAG: thiol-disulfide oxidoreductase DCC family protein [Phycisphaerales bacterium]